VLPQSYGGRYVFLCSFVNGTTARLSPFNLTYHNEDSSILSKTYTFFFLVLVTYWQVAELLPWDSVSNFIPQTESNCAKNVKLYIDNQTRSSPPSRRLGSKLEREWMLNYLLIG